MTTSRPGKASITICPASQPIDAVAKRLRQALVKANSSLTLQEGLYLAYKCTLFNLALFEDVPDSLQIAVRAMRADLRDSFGFDEATGEKVRTSTLDHRHAAALLAHLATAAAYAEMLAAHPKTSPTR